MFVHVQCDVVNCYRPIDFFHRDVRCLFEGGISKVMSAQVGLLVHALSILNFDGLYFNTKYLYTSEN
jgi:hypothetical protein